MRIAFASSDGTKIDEHFGFAKNFYLYDVDMENSELLKVIDSAEDIEDEVEKLNFKINTINEADILYCTQIGPKASKMVQAAKIHPVRVAEGEPIEEAVTKLHAMLNDAPPPWLLRIYHKAAQRDAQ
ncbi:MAG TPA: nitrogen fixation protein NifX [Epsilonproteobacteria bacterium]|nr:nitrogen fixation protein NifX [Campylobacterota bacterium]